MNSNEEINLDEFFQEVDLSIKNKTFFKLSESEKKLFLIFKLKYVDDFYIENNITADTNLSRNEIIDKYSIIFIHYMYFKLYIYQKNKMNVKKINDYDKSDFEMEKLINLSENFVERMSYTLNELDLFNIYCKNVTNIFVQQFLKNKKN